MLRGLGKLTWIEIKIFMREPLGAIGTIVIPVLVFVLVGREITSKAPALSTSNFARVGLPVMVSILIVISAVLSLVTIISIYREGGILKRLRATPLRPQTILSAHVLVKLLLTAATLLLMVLAGRRYIPPGVHPPIVSFAIALTISTWSILSICHRQHCSHRSIRATGRSSVVVPHGRALRPVCARRVIPTRDARTCARIAYDLCRQPASGHLGRRPMVSPPRGCGNADRVLPAVYRAFGQDFSLGIEGGE
jgi:hypothetical protein